MVFQALQTSISVVGQMGVDNAKRIISIWISRGMTGWLGSGMICTGYGRSSTGRALYVVEAPLRPGTIHVLCLLQLSWSSWRRRYLGHVGILKLHCVMKWTGSDIYYSSPELRSSPHFKIQNSNGSSFGNS